MSDLSRRNFLKAGVAAGALASGLPLQAERASATDWVTLGRSGVKVTRLAFGTGTFSGQVQQELGQEGVHAAGAPRLRPRHPLLRDRRSRMASRSRCWAWR